MRERIGTVAGVAATMSATSEVSVAEWNANRLDGVAASFAAARDAVGVSLHCYSIAGASVRLRFASPALCERLTPAFAHLIGSPDVASTSTDLTVQLWDSASTGAPPPPRPHTPEHHAPGAMYYVDRPPLRAAYMPTLDTLSILDAETTTAWHWVADAAEQPYWDEAAPLRQIMHWWLRSRGYLQVHGGSVGTPEGGVLLVGRGGSGKSTTALSSLGSELLYAADDYVALALEPSPWIQSLYSSGKLDPPHVREFLPQLVPLLANGGRLDTEKAVVYVHEHFPQQTTSGFPLRAVLVPTIRRGQREPRAVEASRAAAFAALAPSTILQLHTAGPDAFATMSRLVERVPCFGLELGSDVSAIPGVIAHLLSTLPSSSAS